MSLSPEALQKLIEESRRKLAERNAAKPPISGTSAAVIEAINKRNEQEFVKEAALALATPPTIVIPEAGVFTWNDEQKKGFEFAESGKSFNFIGAAGVGKTTAEKEMCKRLIEKGLVKTLGMSTKYLHADAPGILITSFTRRAVRASRRVMPEELKDNCITLHKVLEFEPVFYEVWDNEANEMKKTMRFEPARNRRNPLPSTLKTIIIDESPMCSVDLFKQLWDALPDPSKVQFIFVGDLYQLPPVYGSGILGFKLLELPTVELTKIYRQAAQSPIISLAHRVKNGETIPVTEKTTVETTQGKVTIHPFKKPFSDFDGAKIAGVFLKQLVTEPEKFATLYGITRPYDEEEDIILCPQEKVKNLAFGTNELNRIIAQALGEKRNEGKGAVVYEIRAGFNLHYYAVGDRILHGREDAVIISITRNAKYWGKKTRPASVELDRWGNYKKKVTESTEGDDDFDVDTYLESFNLESEDADRKQEASHFITVKLLDSEIEDTLSTAAEINATQFAYCITVHKSQGSEWRRVFFLTHQSHVTMWSRELLYTAITRAREELYMILEPDRGGKVGTLTKAARSPRIKGDTLAEKAEYFKGKQEEFKEKMAAGEDQEKGEAKAGQYKGTRKETPIAVPVSTKPPVEIVRFESLVSAKFKSAAQAKLDALWERAKIIWGDGKIGKKPTIRYNLQSSKVIGLAKYFENELTLNAVWCVVADHNEKIWKEMIDDTIPHELAHFINQHYSTPKGKGHDGGWVMAAKLLGMVNPEATTSEFPSWAEAMRTEMRRIVAGIETLELAGQNKAFSKEDDFINLFNNEHNVEA